MKPRLNIKSRLKKLLISSWFITLFATTLGVLLAFYLSNLNDRSKIEHRKQISIRNLNQELMTNTSELLDSVHNEKLIDFLSTMKRIDNRIPNQLKISVDTMNILRKNYSDFLRINDSIEIEDDRYQYNISYKLELILEDLQNIAWETAKMSGITNEMDYDCLQVLVKIYALQEIFIKEQQKILDQFVIADHDKLLSALRIVQQLRAQLLDAIKNGQKEIKNCS